MTRTPTTLIALASAAAFALPAHAAVEASLTTPPGASAVVTVGVTVTTALGTTSDTDVKTVAVTGSDGAALMPNSPPFSAIQSNTLLLNLADTAFTFNLYCSIFGCLQLNATVNDLTFTQSLPACSTINAATGAVSFNDMQLFTTGSYTTSGLASSSGVIAAVAGVDFTGRITSPVKGALLFDQLALADLTFVVPPDQLPSGVSALTFTVQTNLANTTMSGPYASTSETFDADGDGIFNACDACTDTDGDGFGDDAFSWNTCADDNCPGVPNPAQYDGDGDGIGNACECPADIAPAPGDNVVNVSDLLALIGAWGASGPPGSIAADVNRDGVVNVSDLLALIGAWGGCP